MDEIPLKDPDTGRQLPSTQTSFSLKYIHSELFIHNYYYDLDIISHWNLKNKTSSRDSF